MRVIVEPGKRLGSKIIHINDGFYYHINRRKRNSLNLRCIFYYSKSCPGRASCSADMKYFESHCVHNHGQDKCLPAVWKLRRNILSRCLRRDPSRYVDIIEQESVGFSMKVRSQNMAVTLRSAMRRARQKHLPSIPEDLSRLDEILRQRQFKLLASTMRGRGYLYRGRCGTAHDRSRCLIFMSSKMESVLRIAKIVFCDSSWDARPAKPKSSQVFSMTTTWDSQIIPLCVCLMESKKQSTYLKMFQSIRTLVPAFSPNEVHCDFESAQYNAILQTFVGARVVGCLYHYANNVSVYAKKLGLTYQINSSKMYSSVVRSCLAIPLVPCDLIGDALQTVMQRAFLLQFYDSLRPLFEYIYNEYISKRGHVLSVCDCDDRTTNVAESFNAKMQNAVGQKQPNVYQFIGGLQRLEERAQLDIHCMVRGLATGRPRKVSAISNNAVIKALTRRLRSGHITLDMFLRRASYALSAPYRRSFPDASSSDDDDDSDNDEF